MSSIRQEATSFLDGTVIGFFIMLILILAFLYTDFIPTQSYLLALFAGGCVAGFITRGTWKGGVSAFFSGFLALFLFDSTKDLLTLEYSFATYQLMLGFFAALAGGMVGGFFTRSKTSTLTRPRGEPAKVYVCPQCGAEIPMKTKFCPECGTRLGKTLKEKIKKVTPGGGEEQ